MSIPRRYMKHTSYWKSTAHQKYTGMLIKGTTAGEAPGTGDAVVEKEEGGVREEVVSGGAIYTVLGIHPRLRRMHSGAHHIF